MTNADTMFKELGYTKTENEYGIWYDDESSIITGYVPVSFNKKEKQVDFETYVDIPLLKAINQKCKELGWLDD